MARPLRIEGEDCVYHLTARGDRRQAIFRDEEDRARFRDRLVASLERFQVDLHAWVLMPNHFHFLARTRAANLSRWMQWLLGCVTMDFNRRHRLCGHLFQGRFKAILVEERGYFAELGRYLHLNPVRGTVLGEGDLRERRARLRAWHWSSYQAYAGLEAAPSWLEMRDTYGELGLMRSRDRAVRYRRFVENGLLAAVEDPRALAEGQLLLGSEGFVQQMKDRLRSGRNRSCLEGVAHRGLFNGKERGALILEEMQRGALEPAAAMTRLQEEAGWTLREIGEEFGSMSANAVGQRIYQWRRRRNAKI